jgi:hypothetical protein
LKRKYLVTSVFCLALALAFIAGCAPGQTTPQAPATVTVTTTPKTTTPATTTPTADKKYNVLSPRGVALPVQIKGLVERPSSLDGLIVYVDQAEADPIIMPALWARVQKDYPKVQWKLILPTSLFGPNTPEAIVVQEAKGVIRGVGW